MPEKGEVKWHDRKRGMRWLLQGRYGNGEIREIVLGSRYQAVQNRINEARYYAIRPGDTLSGIAVKYGTTYQQLAWIKL